MGNGVGVQQSDKASPLAIGWHFSTRRLFFYARTKGVLRKSNCGHALAKNRGLLWDHGHVE